MRKVRWSKRKREELVKFFHDQLEFYYDHQSDILLFKGPECVAYLGESKIEMTKTTGYVGHSFLMAAEELTIDSLNAVFAHGHSLGTLYEAFYLRDSDLSFKTPADGKMIVSGDIDMLINVQSELTDGKRRVTISASVSDMVKDWDRQ